MNQLSLRASELHEQAVASFKVSERFAYDFIMKVKQIRDERLYKELEFSSFDDYCEQAWSIKRDYMDQRIQIAESFGEDNFADTYRQLGHSKSLLLARMEPEVRQQIESTVDVNEATVKQLKEAQGRAEEAERRASKAESTAIHNEKLWRQAQSQPPRIETKTVEVVPDRLQKELEELRFQNTGLKHGYKEAKEKLQHFELQNTVDFNAEQMRKQREKMQHEADYNTLELRVHITNFMEKAAITSYMTGAIAAADPITKKKLSESVAMLEQFAHQIKAALNSRILGGIVNE